MKKIFLFFIMISGFGFQSMASTLNLDDYLADEAIYLFNGKPYVNTKEKASIKKEVVNVLPLGKTMVRYIFRSANKDSYLNLIPAQF